MKPNKKLHLNLIASLIITAFTFSACAGGSETVSQTNNDLGKQVFMQKCATCHSLEEDQTIVGPALPHIATIAETRLPDKSAQEYIEAMLVDPTTFDLEDYPNVMPQNMKGQITTEEYTALVDYLMTLK
ncbi:MAG: cytochrome c [Anaerolineales bacterium]|nr:cytochrome c [Anaerolineales bacterium]